jgi:[ribosomal protein S5]-alanine N-acetyltransferase
MISIQSHRLELIPLDYGLLLTWQKAGREIMLKQLGLEPLSPNYEAQYWQETLEALSEFWLPQTARFSTDFFWYTNWEIVLKPLGRSVGGIGLSGLPDDQGLTTVGYGIEREFWGQHLATEALGLLCGWAFKDPTLKGILANTFSTNIPSHRVLQNNAFLHVGSSQEKQADGQDAEVWQWMRLR